MIVDRLRCLPPSCMIEQTAEPVNCAYRANSPRDFPHIPGRKRRIPCTLDTRAFACPNARVLNYQG